MKKRRPTIPFCEWKFAVDLEQTRHIQCQDHLPTAGCTCTLCTEWPKVYAKALPNKMVHQLERIGIDLTWPSELYGVSDPGEDRSIRIMFHFVGKVLSGRGNSVYIESLENEVRYFKEHSYTPSIWMMVLPASESWEVSPERDDGSLDQIICIDMRLSYPERYAHEHE